MTDKKTELKPLPEGLDDTDLGGLQNLHSEMLATAHDIGLQPQDMVLEEVTTIPQGLLIVRQFHADIEKFLAGVDTKEYKPGAQEVKPPAAAKPKKDKKKPAPGKPAKSETPQDAMARQKAARLAKEASEPKPEAKAAKPQKENTVAKKAVKKAVKKAAKKSATTNARTSVDGTKKITWLLKDKDLGARDGSERAERRKKLRAASGKTVDAYVKGGGSIATLNRAVSEKIVKLG